MLSVNYTQDSFIILRLDFWIFKLLIDYDMIVEAS
jgi:hypothetical protein